jgi:hypothetical protein
VLLRGAGHDIGHVLTQFCEVRERLNALYGLQCGSLAALFQLLRELEQRL